MNRRSRPHHRYLIALGSNRCGPHGRPSASLRTALDHLAKLGFIRNQSTILSTTPIGPSRRQFANAVAVLDTALPPPALLVALKGIERHAGRRLGRRWGDRVLDLDIILWSGGTFSSPTLTVPHPLFRTRGFVLAPAATIAANWRDPVTGLTLRQLAARLAQPKPLDRAPRPL